MNDSEGMTNIARALSIPEHHTQWERLSLMEQSKYFMQADYALSAMRHPTPEMIAAAWTVINRDKAKTGGLHKLGPGVGVREVWQAMVAALRGYEVCDQCNGAGGNGQGSICGKCDGAGGYPKE